MKPIKKYIIYLNCSHTFTKYDDRTETLEEGKVLWSQDEPFTLEQYSETKTKGGFDYIWGLPEIELVPIEKIKFAKVEEIVL